MQVENRHALVDSANAVGSPNWLSSWFFDLKFTWIVTFVIVVVPFIRIVRKTLSFRAVM
jgi:hypothetical protein